jgi:hypothetical protein
MHEKLKDDNHRATRREQKKFSRGGRRTLLVVAKWTFSTRSSAGSMDKAEGCLGEQSQGISNMSSSNSFFSAIQPANRRREAAMVVQETKAESS